MEVYYRPMISEIYAPSAQRSELYFLRKYDSFIEMKKLLPSFIKTPLRKVYLYVHFIKDFFIFKRKTERAGREGRFPLSWKNCYPQLYDKTDKTYFDTHYIYHPAWAMRIVKKINPSVHVDISSTLTFSSMLSSIITVKFYDYRPAHLNLENLTSEKADLIALPFPDTSIKSLSCMHTVEHIGLGRYGDPIDPDADLKAMKELERVLAQDGDFIFVTPIGKPKLQFNAHRVYSYEQIISYFPHLSLQEFSLVPDNALETGIIYNATKTQADAQRYGCGLFHFKRI